MKSRKLFKYIPISTLLLFLLLGFLAPAQPASAATIRTAPTNGLVGYWSFNSETINGTKVRDLTNNGNTGTIAGGAIPVKGKLNEALSFDAVDDTVDFGSRSKLNVNTALTIGMWFKKNGVGGGSNTYHALITRLSGNDGYQVYIPNSTNVFRFYSGGVDAPSTYVVADSNWHYYTVANDGSLTRFYVDGVAYGTASQTLSNVPVSTSNAIGAHSTFGKTNGLIDDVRIYNRALSADEVMRVYQAGGVSKVNASQVYGPPTPTTNLQSGLVGMWDFNAGNMGTTSVLDASGNNSTGWLIGGVKKVIGKVGQGLQFNGSYVQVPSITTITNSLALCTWFKRNPGNKIMLGKYGTGGDYGYELEVYSDNKMYLTTSSNGTLFSQFTSTGTTVDRGWNHLCAVYSASTVALYLNGAVVPGAFSGTEAVPASLFNPTQPFEIGRASGLDNYVATGLMDEVRVYNRSLSQSEITALHRLGVGSKQNASQASVPPTPTTNLQSGLVGMWDFGASKMGTTSALDASGSNNTAWLIGGVKKVIGKVGQGLSFDGSTGYITSAGPTAFGQNPLSASAWLKPGQQGASGYGLAVSVGCLNGAGTSQFFLGWIGATAQVGTANSIGGGIYGKNFGSGITDRTKFHHVTITSSGGATQTIKLYVDGVLTNQDSGTANLTSSGVTLGRCFDGSSNYSYNGLTDDVRVYNRELSQAEVTALYRMGK